jgi:predicted DNA-binding WGR domain protein
MHHSGYSGINVIEKNAKDPGISTYNSKHKIHWWPKNKRIARLSRAMHQMSSIRRSCLIVEYGRIVKEDGQLLTKQEFSKFVGLRPWEFDENIKLSRKMLKFILKKNDKRLALCLYKC